MKQSYDALGRVRVTFRTEGMAIPNSNKIELFFSGHQKLWEVKARMGEFTKHNIFFYINQSFMPALDSRVGDLAQCYGRYDADKQWHDLCLIVNDNEGRYG